ncbi:hypothetical protein ACVNNN_19815 [Lysinibacillus fusiformis]|uniref:hypothetical protein n=1 Tax=Lysinibacillus sp. PWR01 TaxID=3342384 RepID=UPI00372D1212
MFISKIYKVYDIKEINLPEMSTLRLELENEVKKAMNDLVNKYANYCEIDGKVKNHDLVLLDFESNYEKFNKSNIPVVVGMGLFDKLFEGQLINLNINNQVIMKLNKTDVKVTIKKIERKILPDLNDDLVKMESIENVTKVNEYIRFIKEKVTTEKLNNLVNKIIPIIIENSIFEISETDVNKLYECDYKKMRFLSEQENTVLEELSNRELGIRIGFGTLKEFEYIHKNERYPYLLKKALIGIILAKEDNISFNKFSYELSLKNNSYYKQYSLSNSMKMQPFFSYLTYSYSKYLHEKLFKFYKEKLNQE